MKKNDSLLVLYLVNSNTHVIGDVWPRLRCNR